MIRHLVMDTETTGFKEPAAIVEIAWAEIDQNAEVIGRMHSLIDPELPIEPGASGVHGITNDMVADQPTMEEFLTIVAGNPFNEGEIVVVAHNAAYDLKFVGPLMQHLAGSICTLKCARRVYPDMDEYKLQTLRYALGLNVEAADAHSAAGDVEVCLALLKRMMQDSGLDLEGMRELSSKPMAIRKISFGKYKGTKLEDLPADYVHWLLHKAEINDDLRQALVSIYG